MQVIFGPPDRISLRDGRKVSNFTLKTYYRCLNGALNAAVREDFLRDNPFNRIDKRDKIRGPESKREFLTIDEVKLRSRTKDRKT